MLAWSSFALFALLDSVFLVGVVSEELAPMRVDVEVGVCLTVAEFEGSFALASEDLDVDVAETDLVLILVAAIRDAY